MISFAVRRRALRSPFQRGLCALCGRHRAEYLNLFLQILALNPLNRRRLTANDDVYRLLLALLYVGHRTAEDRLRPRYVDLLGFLGLYHVRESDGRVVRAPKAPKDPGLGMARRNGRMACFLSYVSTSALNTETGMEGPCPRSRLP